MKENIEELEKEAEKKAKKRQRKKKVKMKVSGRSVFSLQKILKEKKGNTRH